MSTSTTRAGIRIPDLADAADAHADWLSAMNTIDGLMAITLKGTFAARPAAGTVSGKYYYATDTGAFYTSDGSTWQLLNAFPLADQAAGTASLRTLGTSAVQAAAGNDSRLSDTRIPSASSIVTAMIQAGQVTWAQLKSYGLFTFSAQIGYVGAPGTSQQRAGRQLARTDFTTLMAGSEPALLWNCSSLTVEQSINTRAVTNTGLGLDSGIEGAANTAVTDSAGTTYAQIPNAVKIPYGSWGGWFRIDRRKNSSTLMGMWSSGTDNSIRLITTTTGHARFEVSTGGGALVGNYAESSKIVDDGLWHFIVATWDGSRINLFIDGALDASSNAQLLASNNNLGGPANQSATLTFGVLANSAGASITTGSADEIFITPDVLEEDQVKILYCKKYSHTLGTVPYLYGMNVRSYRRFNTYNGAFFTGLGLTQPVVGSNMRSNASWTNDSGSGAPAMTNTSVVLAAAGMGPDQLGGAWYFNGAANQVGSDSLFQTGVLPQTNGFWIKCNPALPGTKMTVFAQGTVAGAAGRQYDIDEVGNLLIYGTGAVGTSQVTAPGVADGQWHHIMVVENQDKKVYVDGYLVDHTTVAGASITAGGASAWRFGQNLSAAQPYTGYLAGFWHAKTNYSGLIAQTIICQAGQNKLNRRPYDALEHIELVDNANIYLTFDQLEDTDFVELLIA